MLSAKHETIMENEMYHIPEALLEAIRNKTCIILLGEKFVPELLRKEQIFSKLFGMYNIKGYEGLNYEEKMLLLQRKIDPTGKAILNLFIPYKKLEKTDKSDERGQTYFKKIKKISSGRFGGFKGYLSTSWLELNEEYYKKIQRENANLSKDSFPFFEKCFGTFSRPASHFIVREDIRNEIGNRENVVFVVGIDLKDPDFELIRQAYLRDAKEVYFHLTEPTEEMITILKKMYQWEPVYNSSDKDTYSELFDYIIEQSPEDISAEERIEKIYNAVTRFAMLAKSGNIIRNAANFGALATPDSTGDRFFDSGEQATYEEKAAYEWLGILKKQGVTARCIVKLGGEKIKNRYDEIKKNRQRLEALRQNIRKFREKIEIIDLDEIDLEYKVDIYDRLEAIRTEEREGKVMRVTHNRVLPNVEKAIADFDEYFERNKYRILGKIFNEGKVYDSKLLIRTIENKLDAQIREYKFQEEGRDELKEFLYLLDNFAKLECIKIYFDTKLDRGLSRDIVRTIDDLLSYVKEDEMIFREFEKIKKEVELFTIKKANDATAVELIDRIRTFLVSLSARSFDLTKYDMTSILNTCPKRENTSYIWLKELDGLWKQVLIVNYRDQYAGKEQEDNKILGCIFGLKVLDLRDYVDIYKNVSPFVFFKHIEHLYVKDVKRSILDNVLRLIGYEQLKTLCVTNEGLEDRAFEVDLGGIKSCVNLENLFLVKVGLREISGLQGLTKLKVLNLFHNNIVEIEPLAKLSALEQLSIRTIRGIDERKTLFGLKNLEFLILSNAKGEVSKILFGKNEIAEEFKDSHIKDTNYCFSHLSIDPIHGCTYACSYCLWSPYYLTNCKPKRKYTPEETLELLREEIKKYDLHRFRSDLPRIPISIGNTTDIGISENQDFLLDFLEKYAVSDVERRPVLISTKAVLKDDFLKELNKQAGELKSKIVIAVSTSTFSEFQKYERGVPPPEERIENFERISQYEHLVGIHRWRPIFVEDNFKAILNKLKAFRCKASIINGVAAGDRLAAYFESEHENPFHEIYCKNKQNFHEEFYVPDLLNEILAYSKEIDYPVFYRQTSCGISYALEIPDFFHSYRGSMFKPNCKKSNCPVGQRGLCEKFRDENEYPSIALLQRIAEYLLIDKDMVTYDYEGEYIAVDKTLTLQQQNYLSHATGFLVRASWVDPNNNEWVGSHRNYE